jgi:cystathionine beta-lyase/cystathionine gamma-synthase
MELKTRCARPVDGDRRLGRPLAPVIVPSSTFCFDDQAAVDRHFDSGEGYVYSRHGNPTVREVERLLADLEGAEDAAMFSSGMAAISTLFLSMARAGQRVAAQRELYGGTADLLSHVLPGLGLEVRWFSLRDLAELQPAQLEGCRLLFIETPTNPTLRVIDLRAVTRAAARAGVPVAVDSTFATPILQRPLEHGADLVIHSATKYLGGHGDLIGGAVAGRGELVHEIALRRRTLGGILDPFPAFLLHRGMRTLAVRLEAQCRGAGEVARGLSSHPNAAQVLYPGLPEHPDHALARQQMDGFGGMVTLTVGGGAEQAIRFHDRLRLFARAGSLGGVESLVSIPATMSHRYLDPTTRAELGIPDDMVRLSIGLESPGDLLEDLTQALA